MNFAIGSVNNSVAQGDVANGGGKKHKLSSYQLFVKREFKKCQKDYPSKKAPEIMKIIAKKWKDSKKN